MVIRVQSGASMRNRLRAASGGSGPPPPTFPLDGYPMPAFAYSVQRLRGGVTAALRERRTTDNAEQDRGFVSGWVDQSASQTFASLLSSYAPIWYDQSTNLRHAVQTVAGNQPMRVDLGTPEAIGPQARAEVNSRTQSGGAPLLAVANVDALSVATAGGEVCGTVVYQVGPGEIITLFSWNDSNTFNRITLTEFSDNNLYLDIGNDSSGRTVAIATRGQPHVMSFYRSGSVQGMRIDSGAWVTASPRTALISGTANVELFRSTSSATCGMAESVIWNSFIGLSQLDAWHNSRTAVYL